MSNPVGIRHNLSLINHGSLSSPSEDFLTHPPGRSHVTPFLRETISSVPSVVHHMSNSGQQISTLKKKKP